jgi:predicted small lipoprotein YifL
MIFEQINTIDLPLANKRVSLCGCGVKGPFMG